MLFTNRTNIPLPLAVWLAHDEYDFIGGYGRISATSLLKPTRRFILGARVPMHERDLDLADFISLRMGHAFHDSIESSWKNGYAEALRKIGYPKKAIDRVKINPTMDEVNQAKINNQPIIPVHIEQRVERKLGDFTVSGKFDMCIEGQLYDVKSTSVYSHIMGNKDMDYILQGSIYRWLNPEIITRDQIHITHIFTDWSRAEARRRPDYPQSRLMPRQLDLLGLPETENYVGHRIGEIKKYWKTPEADIPFCTDEELWRSAPKYKYFSDPAKAQEPGAKSTKNFDDLASANLHRAEKGKGVVITVPGQVKACSYCPAFSICTQKDLYDHE